jgi:branched-chain amino acid aminotransferase
VKDGRIKTPSDDVGSLSGITQKAVIELAEKRGIKTEFKKMFPEELYSADECFLTGTAAEIIPVIKIEENRIGAAAPGRITRMLLADFKKLTKTDGEAY